MLSTDRLRGVVPMLLLLALAGCASMAKGVTEAFLDQQGKPGEDTRSCEIAGRPFPGVAPYLARQESYPPIGEAGPDRPITKILMVHGIGTHEPGYSAPLVNGLATRLDLTSRAPRAKRIVLASPRFPNETMGELNIDRLVSADRKEELLFFELTWSPINAKAKEAIAFDQSNVYAVKRAGINNTMKAFVDDIAPDPLAYAGANKDRIRASVAQSLCWALSARWDDLSEETKGVACGPDLPAFGSRVAIDDVAFVSHSLGSRVLIDALQDLVKAPEIRKDPRYAKISATFQQRKLQAFMLSNQLPLLETGQPPQQVTESFAQYCEPGGSHYADRFFKALDLVAFSDPNDLLSYPIPEQFVDRYMDSRLCTRLTNITINVAPVHQLFGLGEVASPLEAHSGYESDERVIALVAHGAGSASTAPIVKERCKMTLTDDTLK
jgi:hypothetical protein